MNKYDEYFDFRIARTEDTDAIMQFLKEEWGENHILANDKEFFFWQYGNEQYGDIDTINFVLMLDKQKNIVGANGFIAYAQKAEERYVSSAITIVKKNLRLPMCGVELIRRFKELVPAQAYYSAGTNSKTMLPIGKRIFHYATGVMQQYYLLNPQIDEYRIAVIKHAVCSAPQPSLIKLKEMETIEELTQSYDVRQRFSGQAFKSSEYIHKRFFEHPVYQYRAWGLWEEERGKCVGVLFGRELEQNGRKILRLVDYLGDIVNLAKLGAALLNLMQKEEYEYIDLLVGTLPEELMNQSGFALQKEEDGNIIPTYFEPFVQRNVNICYQKSDASIVIFKADGDQDRPNKRS